MATDMLLFLGAGILIGLVVGYLLTKAFAGNKFEHDPRVHELEKQLKDLQISAANKLSRDEVNANYVSRELHLSVCADRNKITADYKYERELMDECRTTILRLTAELEQKLSKSEVERLYVTRAVYDHVNGKLNQLENEVNKKDEIVLTLNTKLTEATSYINFLEEKLTVQKEEIEAFRQKSVLEFENIASRIMRAKTAEFTELNKVNIEAILKPLNEEIGKFKTRVDEVYEKESKQRFSLEEKVKELVEQTNKVSSEANNLASALKGQVKKQGNWGEVILESILEKSGLVKNREYFIQPTIKNEEGKIIRPDVLVHLPDNRTIIIDSKMSLVAYDRFWNCDVKEQQDQCLADHLRSIYNHIDNLHGKKYDNIESALDFTMMFVPIESAYLIAIQQDPDLWAYAYNKRILMISPTNLIASLKLMADIWKRDNQSKNAMEIVKRGELLYEKFAGFTASMAVIGGHLNNAQSAYDSALMQLKNGQGNLIWQAIQLKNMGLKSTKQLPVNWVETALEEGNNATNVQ